MDLRQIHHVAKSGEMFNVMVDLIVMIRLVRKAMAEHIDGEYAKVVSMRKDIALVSLEVTAAAVKQDERHRVRTSGGQAASADAVDVDVSERELALRQIGPEHASILAPMPIRTG